MWTVYYIHVKPLPLRDPERFEPGTVPRVVDYATGKQLPPDGAVVRVKSRDHELSWARNEAGGDVEITIDPEITPAIFASRFARAKIITQLRADNVADE